MTEQTNTPELRFPKFENDWKIVKLQELLSFNNGINASKNQYGVGRKFINVLDILNNNFITYNNIIGKVDVSEKVELNNKVEHGDMLFLRSSETREEVGLANTYLDNKYALFGGFVIRGKRIKEYSPLFLKETLNKPRTRYEIGVAAGGSTRFNVSQDILKNVTLYLPELEEQRKISNFFSKIDCQIELEEKKLELLEQQKRGYMQKIFSQEIRFKDDNGNSYPEWESAPLFDIFSATKGKSLSKDKISNDGKYECILYGEIYTTYAEKIESIVSRTNYYEGILSQKNDLIFPNSTTTNAWDLATFSSLQKNNVLIGGDISILRTKRSDISSLFYAYYLTNYLKLRKDIAKYAQGITIVHLSFNNFCKIKVQIPSLEEQNSITDFIDSLNQQQKLITNKIKLLKERKKGFLQKMFV